MRVLGIYHHQESHGMLGDQIVFMGILETLRVRHGLDKVDVAYIDNEHNPFRAHGNYWDVRKSAKSAMTSMHELLPELGKIHRFVSDIEFCQFFNDTYDDYVHWPGYPKGRSFPSPWIQMDFSYGSKTYAPDGTGLHHIKTPLNDFVKLHGYLPRLRLDGPFVKDVRDWAESEMKGFNKAVMCSVRWNEGDPGRNTPREVWGNFFLEMKGIGIRFFVCSHPGEQEHFRDYAGDHVVFTKDFNFDWREDLALMELSRCVLFPNGGLMSWPWFAGIPSITFGRMPCHYNHFPRLEGMEHGGQLGFAGPLTKQCWDEYDSGTMIREFNELDEKLTEIGRSNPWENIQM